MKRKELNLNHLLFVSSYKLYGVLYSCFRYLFPRYWKCLVIPTLKDFLSKYNLIDSIRSTIDYLYMTDQLLRYLREKYLYKYDYRRQRKITKFPLFVLPYLRT